MSRDYDVTTATTRRAGLAPDPAASGPVDRRAGLLCAAGGLIAVAGALWQATLTTTVPNTQLSYPLEPGPFVAAELVWTLTHVLTFLGALALVRSGVAGPGRLARIGGRVLLTGMAVLVPAELGFAFFSTRGLADAPVMVVSSVIGLAATLAGLGFTLVGIAVLRERRWRSASRFVPLLCGLVVLLVLLPVQAAAPSLFLLPIALWNASLALLGAVLARRTAR